MKWHGQLSERLPFPWRFWVLAFLFLLGTERSFAHRPSDAYLTVRVTETRVDVQAEFAMRDLEYLFEIDANGDGRITWGELKARHAEIAEYFLDRFHVRCNASPAGLNVDEQLVAQHSDGGYAVVRAHADFPAPLFELEMEYQILFDQDPLHRGLLNLEWIDSSEAGVFSPDRSIQVFRHTPRSRWVRFLEFFREGVHHIWKGFDHILFLIALLLPAVLRRIQPGETPSVDLGNNVLMELPDRPTVSGVAAVNPNSRWSPVDAFRPAFWGVFRIVTAFTVAHSITLSLAALDILKLPSRWVESCIAASVAIAAANNLRPFFRERAWLVAFVFGLVHGFGFASVLQELGLPRKSLLLALVGFNLGVEAGQLAIVAVFLPVAFWIRRSFFYQRVIVGFGSIVILLTALAWLVDRAFRLGYMPF